MVIAYLKLLLFSSENASVLSRGYLVAVGGINLSRLVKPRQLADGAKAPLPVYVVIGSLGLHREFTAMQQQADKIVQTLKARSLRVTFGRKDLPYMPTCCPAVITPTAEDIPAGPQSKCPPTSSQATVYSSLQALRDVGLNP